MGFYGTLGDSWGFLRILEDSRGLMGTHRDRYGFFLRILWDFMGLLGILGDDS